MTGRNVILILLFVWSGTSFGQKTEAFSDENLRFAEAVELYDKGQYGGARNIFEDIAKEERLDDQVVLEAEFYTALCALNLFNQDAELLLKHFINRHPDSPKVRLAYYHLGSFYYRKKKYEESISWLKAVDPYDISGKDLVKYHFMLGYGYFELEDYDRAKQNFFEIRDNGLEYQTPALYYYSHISYLEKHYQVALEGFMKLKEDKNFAKIVPFYITQIYYLQKRYDDVIAYAPPIMDSLKVKRSAEINQIIGNSYYEKQEYAKALPYLEKHFEKKRPLGREDAYVLGYTQYRAGKFKEASVAFSQVVKGEDDALSQVAYYHMGECFLKIKQKNYAMNAFHLAVMLDYDKQLKESSMFNYAKLAYQLSNNPFHDAIEAFHEFLDKYPESGHTEEIYEYLINVYMNTQNYEGALRSLKRVPKLNFRMKVAYQMLVYNYAVELFDKGEFKKSYNAFAAVRKYPMDRKLTALSYYWSAEAKYNLNMFDEAIADYKRFRKQNGSYNVKEYSRSNYNLGYCHFKKKDYDDAAEVFRNFLKSPGKQNPKVLGDACLRVGDCYFIDHQNSKAVKYYDKAISYGKTGMAYAYYQKASCLGINKDNNKKIDVLEELLIKYPKSSMAQDALFELAETYRLEDQDMVALRYYNQLITEYPNSKYIRTARQEKALVMYRSGKVDESIEMFKGLVLSGKSKREREDPLSHLENIMVDQGRYPEFDKWAQEKGIAQAAGSQETNTFGSAVTVYNQGNFNKAAGLFDSYLQKFPNTKNEIEAHVYKADCHYQLGEKEAALNEYKYLAELESNPDAQMFYTYVAELAEELEKTELAIEYFIKIEAKSDDEAAIRLSQSKLMMMYFDKEDFEKAASYGEKVAGQAKIREWNKYEAMIVRAKSLRALNRKDEALDVFKRTARETNKIYGSMAHYFVAEMHFEQEMYKKVEEDVKELVERKIKHDYWIVKGYILLGENFYKMGDFFNAKATLNSIIDNYDGEELRSVAKQKLAMVVDAENNQASPEQEEMEIEFEGDQSKDANEEIFDDNEEQDDGTEDGSSNDKRNEEDNK